MFPFNVYSWGGWPMIIGITLMWFCLGQLIRLLHTQRLIDAWLLLILLNGLFLTHTTEVLSFVFLSLPLIFYFRSAFIGFIKHRWWFLLIGLTNLILLTPLILGGVNRLIYPGAPIINPDPHYAISDILRLLLTFHAKMNLNYFFTGLFILALLYHAWKQRSHPLFISSILLFIIWFINQASPLLDRIYLITYPWLVNERFYYLLGGLYSVLTADLILRPKIRYKPLLIICLLIIGLNYFIILQATVNPLKSFVNNYAPATQADLYLLRRNQDNCHIYLNEPLNDAGRFIPYITGQNIIFDGSPELHQDYPDRLELLTAIASESAYPTILKLRTSLPFDCVYVGAYTVKPFLPRLSPPLLTSNPHLKLLDSLNGSLIYSFTDASAAANPVKPIILQANDDYLLKQYLIGDLFDMQTTDTGISLRPVGVSLDLYTQLPLKELRLTGQSASESPQPCTLTINGHEKRNLVFPPTPTLIVLKNLKLSHRQNQLAFTCSGDPTSPRFYFSTIELL
jgi:hypothetical protein